MSRELKSPEAFDRLLAETVDRRFDEFLSWLISLASCPSVSATGEGIRECAAQLMELMRSLDIATDLVETGGHPIVRGSVGANAPRIVFFGHYDVVPPGDEAEWPSPPFEPTIRNGSIYGRGVGDNKGQLLAHLAALAVWREVFGDDPPFEILYVFDGEDEIGGPVSSRFYEEHPELFRGDLLFDADASTLGLENPAVFLGLRGILYVELHVQGAPDEWHSSSYGSILPNAPFRLAQALTSLRGEDGRILVEGFYDGVREPSADLRRAVDAIPSSFLGDPRDFGVSAFSTHSPRSRMFFEPQMCVCGISGGYAGKGAMLAVPTGASAKIDFTLVPDQEPEVALRRLRDHLDAHGLADVEIRVLSSCPPWLTPLEHPLVQSVLAAIERVWGGPATLFPSIGGGGGSLGTFALSYGMPCLVVPYGQADLHEHSADEHLSLEWFRNGIKVTLEFMRLVADGVEAAGRSPG